MSFATMIYVYWGLAILLLLGLITLAVVLIRRGRDNSAEGNNAPSPPGRRRKAEDLHS